MSTAEQTGEWGAHIRVPSGTAAVLVVCALALGGGILLLFVGGVLGVTLALVWIAAWVAWVFVQGRLALGTYRARRATADEAPRLHNIAIGLAEKLSVDPLSLWIIPEGGPNALACRVGGPALAVTRSLLDSYGRTELEAVVCHCLVRSHSRQAVAAACASSLGTIGARLAPRVGGADDTRVCTITRYPPALASALKRSDPARGRFAPLWMAAAGPSHVATERRVADLEDL